MVVVDARLHAWTFRLRVADEVRARVTSTSEGYGSSGCASARRWRPAMSEVAGGRGRDPRDAGAAARLIVATGRGRPRCSGRPPPPP